MRTMHLVATVAASLLVLGPTEVSAQSPAPSPSPTSLSWESDKPLEEVSAICVFAFQKAAEDAVADLAQAARACASLDEWVTASQAYPQALGGTDALQSIVGLCTNESLGLDQYTLCHDVRTSLLTPSPAPTIEAIDLESPADAYLAIAEANRVLSNQIRALRASAGGDTRKLAEAWTASATQNEALIDSVLALGLPLEVQPQVEDLVDKTRLVLSLERMLVGEPRDADLYARWQVAKEARLAAASEMRRVLGLSAPASEPGGAGVTSPRPTLPPGDPEA